MNTAPIISTSSIRLAELRRQISAGEYTIDAIAIAEILLRRWRGAGIVHTECA